MMTNSDSDPAGESSRNAIGAHQHQDHPSRKSAPDKGAAIDHVLLEERLFPPPTSFASQAAIGSLAAYESLYQAALNDPESFWGDLARK